jgi:uncharacterized protein (TIGR02996 family)
MTRSRSIFPQLAAPLPGELPLLMGVIDNLTQDDVFLVYADWLEERGDSRGQFLRQYRRLLNDPNRSLVDTGSLPRPWLDLLGIPLLEELHRYELDLLRPYLLPHLEPCVLFAADVVTDDALPLGCTKIGGLPDLPVDTEWPSGINNDCESPNSVDRVESLRFIAQFRLADFQNTVIRGEFPADGLLSLFSVRFPRPGLPSRLIYTPQGTPLVRHQPPKDPPLPAVHPACKLTAREWMCLYGHHHVDEEPALASFFARFADIEPWARPLTNAMGQLVPDVFGKGVDMQILGPMPGTSAARDPAPGPDWRMLVFTYGDYRDHLGWEWGTATYWFIRKTDLREGRFDEISVECG